MVSDKHHIEMEDISRFALEKSADFSFWQEVSQEELNEQVLKDLPEDKLRTFLGVVRNGGSIQLGGFYYRVRAGEMG
jgi:hypothetical protein